MARSGVTTLPCGVVWAMKLDDAVRRTPSSEQLLGPLKTDVVARMGTKTRSMFMVSALQERGRWVLKCSACRHEPMRR